IVLLVVTADQLTKNLWVRSFPEGHSFFEFGFLRLVHVRNTGAAFGILPGQPTALKIVAIIGILALVAIILLARRRFPYLISRGTTVGASLLLGGATGNLIDRLRFGQVTDFIDVGMWPAFNVADSAIVIGAIITALSLLRLTRTVQGRAGGGSETPPLGDDASGNPPPVGGEEGQSPGAAGVG
ncbi:MAG: signal peptidase II, partial [Dehalococcoidales bacterium]